ncbi:MAG: PEPxxWA-CTERM sorting domain-containing protein [Phenylobacterium sp.]
MDVTRTDSTHANISFTANTAGGYYFLGAQAVGVNVNAATWTVGSLTENGAGTIADGGDNNIDGHGLFNQTFDQTDGFTDRSSLITFTLTNTASTWADDASVLTGNNLGNTIGAHIGVCADAGCTSFVTTGFATNGGGGPVPEPATWAMMILGFGGVGALLRRRRLQPAIA